MTPLLSPEIIAYLYQELSEVVFDAALSNITKILYVRTTLAELMQHLTAQEPQLFTDVHSRLLFVCDKYGVPEYIRRELNKFRALAARAGRKRAENIDEASVHASARAIALCIFHFSEQPAPEPLRTVLLQAKPFPQSRYTRKDTTPLVRLIVLRTGVEQRTSANRRFTVLNCLTNDAEEIAVELWDEWSDSAALCWQYATLHVSALRFVKRDKVFRQQDSAQHNSSTAVEASVQAESQKVVPQEEIFKDVYATTPDSVVVLEPDYLVDVTDLAECVVRPLPYGGNARLSLLKKFMPVESKLSLVRGSMVNTCFDMIITNPDVEFEDMFREAIMQKPLSLLPLMQESPSLLDSLRDELSVMTDNSRRMIRRLHWDTATIEPSFISPQYGLQGRLDLLVEYEDDAQRKTVIELKSSKPPDVQKGTWENNAAQVTCYNLLLDSCYTERSGDSSIFYAADLANPLRNVPNDPKTKRHLLALRNVLIAIEHDIISRKALPFQQLTPNTFGVLPVYSQDALLRFAEVWSAASSAERMYVRLFASFVARENWSARVGSFYGAAQQRRGFSALWRQSIAEKEEAFAVLSGLVLDSEASDMEKLHLVFRRTERTAEVANFRKGDIVILYDVPPEASNLDERSFLRGPIVKGSLKEVSKHRVVVSLRNKQLGNALFAPSTKNESPSTQAPSTQATSWAIEHDFLGTEFKSQYESLFKFLEASAAKRALLLGLREPLCAEPNTSLRYDWLTEEQNQRLQEAMAAKEYFLLQGPPGTGKTSRMLRSMAQYLFEQTDEHIVLLAFTNRAVDEICDALKSIAPDFPFIRIGSKDSTEHTDRVLYEFLQNKSLPEIQTMIAETRVMVSTISSLLKNPELLAVKRFSTAIIDEASQIVEPQIIGIAAEFERCIFIGDEKQLPAVVVQPETGVMVRDETLNAVGLRDMRISLFERLLTRCKEQGWTRAFGIISRQGRMHEDIERFPNEHFYDGTLQPLSTWQREPLSAERFRSALSESPQSIVVSNTLLPKRVQEALLHHRVVFVRSVQESATKIHTQEAERAGKIAQFFYAVSGEQFTSQTVGIITPFRAQIATIHKHLPENIRESITVDTVERYQGSERDIIILSLAVNFPSQLRSIQSLSTLSGGLTIDRKLNVALTRARQQIVILGCPEALSHDAIFRQLMEHVRTNGCFLE